MPMPHVLQVGVVGLFFCLLSSASTEVSYANDQTTNAPTAIAPRYPVKTIAVHHFFNSLTQDLHILYPLTPNVVSVAVFWGGFNGLIPPEAYAGLLKALSASGVVVVAPRGPPWYVFNFKPTAADMLRTITWMDQRLQKTLDKRSGANAPLVNLNQGLSLLCHSSGCQTIVEVYRRLGVRVKGLVLLEPVDNDPGEKVPPSIANNETFALGTPVVVIDTELCYQPAISLQGWPKCCPPGWAAQHFYDAFGPPKWYLKAIDYGHADLLVQPLVFLNSKVHICKSAASGHDIARYQNFLQSVLIHFFKGIIGGHCESMKYLEDTSLMPVNVVTTSLGQCVSH